MPVPTTVNLKSPNQHWWPWDDRGRGLVTRESIQNDLRRIARLTQSLMPNPAQRRALVRTIEDDE